MKAALSSSDALPCEAPSYPEDVVLRTAAMERLESSGYTAVRKLRCEVAEAVVVVTGSVPSYYLKQMAQAMVQRLEGIRRVVNLVEVRGRQT
jgi:osmotically-inducible protein OsmY